MYYHWQLHQAKGIWNVTRETDMHSYSTIILFTHLMSSSWINKGQMSYSATRFHFMLSALQPTTAAMSWLEN